MRRAKTVLIIASAVAVVGSAAATAARLTSQHRPYSVNRVRGGLMVRFSWSAGCADRGPPFTGTTLNRRPIAIFGTGSLSLTASFSGRARGRGAVRYRLTLATGDGGRSGTWAMTVTGRYARGGAFRCATGTVSWPQPRKAQDSGPRITRITRLTGAVGREPVASPAGANPFGFSTQSSSPGTRPASWSPVRQKRQAIDLKGQVMYEKRDCYSGPSALAPLAGATLLVRTADGARAAVPLDVSGAFSLTIIGTLPVTATVELASARIAVEPDLAGAQPYQIPLGDIAVASDPRSSSPTPTPKLVPAPVISGDGPAGAANIFAVLDYAARVAAAATPVPIPRVTALWLLKPDLTTWLIDNGLHTFTHTESDTNTIVVGTSRDGSIRRDEWEEFPLAHEYGHVVLQTVADPGSPGGAHTFPGVYPNEPALPWDEGFSHFFAAVVAGTPTPTLECQPMTVPTDTRLSGGSKSSGAMNLSAVPAQPLPNDPNKAQYNEIAIAGTLWQLANYLGLNVPQQGLARIFGALHDNPAHSAREFRDALIKDSSLENADNHDAISQIFRSENLRWLVQLGFNDIDQQAEGGYASTAIQLIVDGPYGRCTPNSDHSIFEAGSYYPAFGDIPYTNDDDCQFTFSSDGATPPACNRCETWSDAAGGFAMELPYKSDGSHLNQWFTISARWFCTTVPNIDPSTGQQDPAYECSPTRLFEFTMERDTNMTNGTVKVSGDYTFTQGGATVPIARFDGQGHCQLLISPGGDCSA